MLDLVVEFGALVTHGSSAFTRFGSPPLTLNAG
jgi:hypothetical protein